MQATADPAAVGQWWSASPEANVILATGRVFDVLDIPVAAGLDALGRMERSGTPPGPVAVTAGDRALFFVATRGTPSVPDEWWSCHLDCEPDTMAETTGLRWHCRDSYVLAPPSRHGARQAAYWIRPPSGQLLPDALRLLEYVADASGGDVPVTGERSARLFRRAMSSLPGGVNSPVRAFGAVGGTPPFIVSGSGAYLTDVNGNDLRRSRLLLGPDDPRARPSRGHTR